MGCRGCPDKSNINTLDSRGNPVVGKAAISEEDFSNLKKPKPLSEMGYQEYVSERNLMREQTRAASKVVVGGFSNDYKRIQLQQMIDIANFEEMGHLTPDQAISALWEMIHTEEYGMVAREFHSLYEEVDKRYEELKKRRLSVFWKP
jgi:hypothetical protein